jgi:hypothetical protein
MRKKTGRTVRTAALVAIAAVAVLAGSGSSARAADEERFTAVERATSDQIVDLGTPGDSVGDMLVFANILYDKSNSAPIGKNSGWCIRTIVGQAWECTWTATFEKGQIVTQGPFYDQGESVLAITGGTGTYKTSRGELRLYPRNAEMTEFDFAYFVKY